MPHTFFFPEFLFHFARKCAVLCLVAHSWLTLCDPMTAARQTPLSLGFSRKEYWSVLPCPSPGYLPKPGIEPSLPHCRQILYRLSHQNFHEEYERKELSKSLNAWCIFVLPSHLNDSLAACRILGSNDFPSKIWRQCLMTVVTDVNLILVA